MKLVLNRAHYPVTALGSGVRAGIWTQGCSIHCAGCISLDTWDVSQDPATETGAIIDWIASFEPQIDGLTISGGEPFDQPAALEELLYELRTWKARRGRPFDVLCYSGYPLERLRSGHANILDHLDAVIAEPFNRRLPTDLVWRGSENQQLVPLSKLGRERYARYVNARPSRPPMQATVTDGITYIGVPRIGDMERLEQAAAKRGLLMEGVSWRA